MNKIVKLFSLIILFSIFILCTSCELSSKEVEQSYILNYSVVGNGEIICQYESGKNYEQGSYIYLLSSPYEKEELISWIINGIESGKNSGIVIELNENYNVIATFSSNKKVDEDNPNIDTNERFIYATFPNNYNNIKASIKVNSKITVYDMNKNNDGVWCLNLTENNIDESKIETILFKLDNDTTDIFTYNSFYNVFNGTGKNKNGVMCGSFSNKISPVMKLSVLELNDLHGYIVQSSEGKSGISNASYIINQIRNEDELDNVVLLGNGDMFQGTALSNLTHGLSVVNCMNEMEFDFMGVGNHEFDWGIEYITQYFDGNKENGEANFPLINSNIKKISQNKLISDSNILPTYLFEKNGVKIGVISMIDDLKSSILASRTKDYDFLGLSLAKSQAIELKNQGADIIIANIHGSSNDYNNQLANMNYNGEWLIDCIINGHTHQNETQVIDRVGQDCPIVQGGSYCYYVGQIDLYVDLNTKEVLSSDVFTTSVNNAGTNYVASTQNIVNDEYNKVKNDLEETYCVSGTKISSKSVLETWAANVMKASTGCICGISNTGGLRSTGNIDYGTEIGLENLYLINPFDNEIIVCELTGKELYQFLNSTRAIYYSLDSNYSLTSLKNDKNKYKVAIIDYVYYWDNFPRKESDNFTGLVFRDCMIADLKLRDKFNPSIDSEARIGNLLNK